MLSSFIRFRKTLVVLWIFLVLVFSFGIARFLLSDHPVVDNSVSIWFKRNDPELVDYERYNRDFGEQEWSILLLRTSDIYSIKFLKDLAELSERLAELEHVHKVISIANARDSLRLEDGVDYDVIFNEDNRLISRISCLIDSASGSSAISKDDHTTPYIATVSVKSFLAIESSSIK